MSAAVSTVTPSTHRPMPRMSHTLPVTSRDSVPGGQRGAVHNGYWERHDPHPQSLQRRNQRTCHVQNTP